METKHDPRELIDYECMLDSGIAEIGLFSEFKEEYAALCDARNKFQNKAKALYPELKWQFD